MLETLVEGGASLDSEAQEVNVHGGGIPIPADLLHLLEKHLFYGFSLVCV